MEKLLKGLVDVAIDAVAGHGVAADESPEQRDRSTWAEVVSTGHDEAGSRNDHSAPRKNENEGDWSGRNHGSPGRRAHQEGREEKSDGDWEVVGEKKKPWNRRAHENENEGDSTGRNHGSPARRAHQEGREEKSDGDWEVVGEKKQPSNRRAHKVPADNWGAYKRPPSEQNYTNHVHQGVNLEPSREELGNLLEACNRLWELDSNRLVPGQDYEIDIGEGTKVYQKVDKVSGSLFRSLSGDVLRRPTFARFCSLLDNYSPDEGHKEVVTSQEKHEETAFIEEISRTAPIQYLHKYLASKGIISESSEEFKEMMGRLWFTLYGRGGGSRSSCAFEHVFVGEIKGRGENAVNGFHNWIQFYLEEAKGKVDYYGYIFPRRRGEIPDSESQLLTVQFEWNGVLKSVSSILIGVSPEFEIALYTLCFFMGAEDNYVNLGPYALNVKCYRLGNDKIGSVFSIAEC